jgi:hypothetical protein
MILIGFNNRRILVLFFHRRICIFPKHYKIDSSQKPEEVAESKFSSGLRRITFGDSLQQNPLLHQVSGDIVDVKTELRPSSNGLLLVLTVYL